MGSVFPVDFARACALVAALTTASCSSHPATPAVDPNEALLGGDGTIFDEGAEALVYPARNMSTEHRGPFQLGDGLFNRNWAPAPATPPGNDGLGPTYNAISCSACHDSRGAPPAVAAEPFRALLLRLSVPGVDDHGGPLPDPAYGGQLQPYANAGIPPEGTPAVTYVEAPGAYADGEAYSLRKPTYSIADLGFGPLDPNELISPRLAPQTVGLGLLEAVDEQTVLSFAARNGGKANRVWDDRNQLTVLGRFGWKANQPSLEQQALGAFRNDIGITSSLYATQNCPAPQTACAAAPMSVDQPELDLLGETAIDVHTLGLAVAARRNLDDPSAQRGEQVFTEIGCASCHIPEMTTGTLADWPELSNQIIRPFTDLLLHDMGRDLADGRSDYLATGSEWRTPPLWNLGLVAQLDEHLFLLHDGRARGFAEAILWHGGQGAAAASAFRSLPKTDRDALVAFLSSL